MAPGLDRHAAAVRLIVAVLQGRMDRSSGALDGLYGMRGARDGIGTGAGRKYDGNHHRGKSMLAGHGGVSLVAGCWIVLAFGQGRGRLDRGGPVAFS